jgi:hypothetical protein
MIQKYIAAIVPILTAAAVFLQSAFNDELLDASEVWQLVALVAGAIAIYLLPLMPGKWAGAAKTGAAIVAALATAVVPYALQGHLTPEQIMVVAIAVLNALGVEVGVQARKTFIDARDTNVVTSLDPEGVRALSR